MAFGLPPKHQEEFKTSGLEYKISYVAAAETAKKLKWKISFLSERGFIAYTNFSATSWSEEVKVKVEKGVILLESKCTGSQLYDWGKNKKNVNAFIKIFNELKNTYTEEEVEAKYQEYQSHFVPKEDDIINRAPLTGKEKILESVEFLRFGKGYFITPLLLYLNVAIFILMAAMGVSIIEPDIDSLILWGANYKPYTLDGGLWRLLTSCFIHIGILHLLMNMYALIYIGALLEPRLGKLKFSIAYILTGIMASSVSLFWNDFTVSAGASGAIFGMYGLFLAMLTTNLIEKEERKALLASISVFVGYNLLLGMEAGIDNAAHIGGLIGGLIIGYALYPSLTKSENKSLSKVSVVVISFVLLALSSVIISNTSSRDIGVYYDKMNEFTILEEKALLLYDMPRNSIDQDYLDHISEVGIPNWEKSISILKEVNELDLEEEIKTRNLKLIEYCNIRIDCYTTIYKAIEEETDVYDNEVDRYNERLDLIINELSETEE